MSYYDDVKNTHRKFGISNEGFATSLTKEEHLFRIGCMLEEVWEYVDAVFVSNGANSETTNPDNFRVSIIQFLDACRDLRKDVDSPEQLACQLDALVDLSVFAIGTAERQGMNFHEGWKRVMEANNNKELAKSSEDSKRSFKIDLVKPEGWKAPDLIDLVSPPKGIIILEGPDGSGKTQLGKYLANKFGGHYMHQTWSEDIELVMPEYMQDVLNLASERSKTQLVILDRHWVSEYIYSKVFRNGPRWPDIPNVMHTQLKELNALYIFCFASLDSKDLYLSNFEQLKGERTEMYSSMDKVFDEYHSFVFKGDFKSIAPELWNSEYGALVNLNSLYFDYTKDEDYSRLTSQLKMVVEGTDNGDEDDE